jgi:hypothetical protein
MPRRDDDMPDLGPCCCCGKAGRPGNRVRNLVMLGRRAPVPGTGWGCLQCGLPPDGAVYVACDACIRAEAEPVAACAGFPKEAARVPIGSLPPGTFEHDMSKHPGER